MYQHLGTTKAGLSGAEAGQRLARHGANLLKPQKRSNVLALLLAQFKSPLILILLFATGLSFFLHDPVNALIILTIVLASSLLGLWQEHSATSAVERVAQIRDELVDPDELVAAEAGCPGCGERRVDELSINEDDSVLCATCGRRYQLPGSEDDSG